MDNEFYEATRLDDFNDFAIGYSGDSQERIESATGAFACGPLWLTYNTSDEEAPDMLRERSRLEALPEVVAAIVLDCRTAIACRYLASRLIRCTFTAAFSRTQKEALKLR